MRIALATCREVPELDEVDQLVMPALSQRGATGIPMVWDDPAADWASCDLVALRSTWDYAERRDEFLAWLRSLPVPVVNPLPVVEWNTDKRYLADLAADGLPVVPTSYDPPSLPTRGEYVVKPAISAGSRDTARYLAGRDDETAAAHLRRVQQEGRVVMVQPYVASVDHEGETAMLFTGGRYSHAACKGALLESGAPPTPGLFAPETITARTPTEQEHLVAEAVHDWLTSRFGTLTYARVDLLRGEEGPLVLEVELTEPSLFIDMAAHAPGQLAEAILASLVNPPRLDGGGARP